MSTTAAPITSIRIIISGAEICLGSGEHILGRGPECAVLLGDPLASRRHAAITVGPDRVTIRDLGSRNGVLVNGDDVGDNHTLAEGDLITLGAQALVLLQISRAGGERPPLTPPLGAPRVPREEPGSPPANKPAPLGRIAVRKRAVGDLLPDDVSANTTLNHASPLGRPAGAFRMIAEAATRAIATNRVDRAEKILEVPLEEVLEMLRAGQLVEPEIVDIAVQHSIVLCEVTKHARWADYLHDLYDLLRLPMPLQVADRLALAMQ